MTNATTKHSSHELLFNYLPRDIMQNMLLNASHEEDAFADESDLDDRRADVMAI